MPAHILPNISFSLENHLKGYKKMLTKPQYNHFKRAIVSISEGEQSLAQLSRTWGTPYRTWWHFFQETVFDDVALLTQSAQAMNYYESTRSDKRCLIILDFTTTFKDGACFEWSDYLWNEETDKSDRIGYESLISLEYNPTHDARRVLGMRRYYHEEKLLESEYSTDDFEKKGECVSRLLSEVATSSCASEVACDGEFINITFVKRCEKLNLKWTGRIKRTLLATYKNEELHIKNVALTQLVQQLEKERELTYQEVSYRNQKIQAAVITISLQSLENRSIRVAICKNEKGDYAFIGSSVLARDTQEILTIYGYRWEIEVFFQNIKENLAFGSFLMRSVAANSRWQIFVLIAANILELVRKTKLEPLMATNSLAVWFSRAVEKMYRSASISFEITINLLTDLRHGGEELIACLRNYDWLNQAKYFLSHGIKVAT